MSSTEPPVVVIGTGPTGAVAAATLVARGVSVLVLESGDQAPGGLVVKAAGRTVFRKPDQTQLRNNRNSSPPGRPSDWWSALTPGGLSNYWTAAVPRFAPDDFNVGASVDERYKWPFEYSDLEPFYETAEHYLTITNDQPILGIPHGVGAHHRRAPRGWQPVIDAAAAAGEGIGLTPAAIGNRWMAARRTTEFESYRCVVAPLESSQELKVRRRAHVSSIHWSSTAGRVDGVMISDQSGGPDVFQPAQAVVLAAGTIDSTAVLLRSTSSDHPDGLGNADGILGRYLHDHPREWFLAELDSPKPCLDHPLLVARASHHETGLLATQHSIGLGAPVDRLRAWAGRSSRRHGVNVFSTMIPTDDLGVRLEADPGGGRNDRIEIALSYDGSAIDNLRANRDRLRDIFALAGISMTTDDPFQMPVPGSSVHLGGSIRMHNRAEFGVLDKWNQLHHGDGLVVCDASCFTTSPEKNPTLTAMAIAIRAADHLADQLG